MGNLSASAPCSHGLQAMGADSFFSPVYNEGF